MHYYRAAPYTTSTKVWQLINKASYDRHFGAGRQPPATGGGTPLQQIREEGAERDSVVAQPAPAPLPKPPPAPVPREHRGQTDMRDRWTGEHDPRYRNPDEPAQAKGSSKDKGKNTKSKGKSSKEKSKQWGSKGKGAKEHAPAPAPDHGGGWDQYRRGGWRW